MKIDGLHARIAMHTVYECAACGKKTLGPTVTLDLQCDSADELRHHLDTYQQRPHHMPVGWSFDNDNQFRCGCTNH